MHATDVDKGVNGQVKYSIVQQPHQKGTKFTVDEETGELFTNKATRYVFKGLVGYPYFTYYITVHLTTPRFIIRYRFPFYMYTKKINIFFCYGS